MVTSVHVTEYIKGRGPDYRTEDLICKERVCATKMMKDNNTVVRDGVLSTNEGEG